jgi:hypothetical protein
MAGPLVVAGTLQLTVLGRTGDGPFANVLHFDVSGIVETFDVAAKGLLGAWATAFAPVTTNSVHWDGGYWIDLDSADGPTGHVDVPSGAPTAGAINQASCPPQVTYLGRWPVTAARGTRNGRSYLPGVEEGQVGDDGNVFPDRVAAVTVAMTNFLGVAEATWLAPLVIVHRVGSAPASTSPVTTGFCEVPVATQRRRLRR